ncbi:hypothetical protein OJF2_67680 [Aquisphaera giovannonii]|uniref:Prepilin-type N-terminal cleavage/methylation domain-containing protein n=1 Tax=Aquisphaera giovannonii TaxID=406548 RepID=A0A5B9WE43_9BACT|nr:type II secretion system protein [Aquisphaera giovannonii]QEH38170.1 hypothetical protein OJF2_67680 [Aquisphaera giovannonii]
MRIRRRVRPGRGAGAFTLVELLVVIAIVGLVSVAAFAVLSHASVAASGAARELQAALVAARDAAMATGRPHGIRLLPDPAFPVSRLADGSIDPSKPLCASRFIPIETAPDYAEGFVVLNIDPGPGLQGFPGKYPRSSTESYPYPGKVLMIEESPVDIFTNLVHPPTSWFWNVRIGDRIRIDGSGTWYTVVGPMTTPNPEMFVNCGTPGVDFQGTKSPLIRYFDSWVEAEYLFLVDGRDDNGDGFVDEGFDGIDNNANGLVDEIGEWEQEAWSDAQAQAFFQSRRYVISRRPVPSPGGVPVTLPSSTVIDLSTWSTTRERSRLPVNAYSGEADILIGPRGDVMPTTVYSTPASTPFGAPFLHFWIADRSDVFDPDLSATPRLPVLGDEDPGNGRALRGSPFLVSMNARSGRIESTTPTPIGSSTAGAGRDPGFPFRAVEQGGR